jgi:hypothetical protein
MSEAHDANLRAAIDSIALETAERGENEDELRALIADKTLEYMAANREQHGNFDDDEIDRIISVIIRGALQRLEQIAIAAGRSGAPEALRRCRIKHGLIVRTPAAAALAGLGILYTTVHTASRAGEFG